MTLIILYAVGTLTLPEHLGHLFLPITPHFLPVCLGQKIKHLGVSTSMRAEPLTQAYLSLDEPKGAMLEGCDQIEADGLDRAHACCACLGVPDPLQGATGARLGVAADFSVQVWRL